VARDEKFEAVRYSPKKTARNINRREKGSSFFVRHSPATPEKPPNMGFSSMQNCSVVATPANFVGIGRSSHNVGGKNA
jgi:hypothetical protein